MRLLLTLLATVLPFAFGSCAFMQSEGTHLGVLAGGGVSKTKANDTETGESVKADGYHGHVRFEVTRPTLSEETDLVRVGLRLGSTIRELENDSFGEFGEFSANLELRDISVAPLLRLQAPVAGPVSVYADGFAGYSFSFGELSGSDSISGTSFRRRDEGSAFFYGAGAGLEIGDDSSAFVIGAEWAQYLSEEIDNVEFTTDDITGLVGFRMRF